jgi:hypothetical protein
VIVNMEENENLAGGGKEYKDTIQIQAILWKTGYAKGRSVIEDKTENRGYYLCFTSLISMIQDFSEAPVGIYMPNRRSKWRSICKCSDWYIGGTQWLLVSALVSFHCYHETPKAYFFIKKRDFTICLTIL